MVVVVVVVVVMMVVVVVVGADGSGAVEVFGFRAIPRAATVAPAGLG